MEKLKELLLEQQELLKALHQDNLELYKLIGRIAEIKTIRMK